MPSNELIKELKSENIRLQKMINFYQDRSEERRKGLQEAVDSCPLKNPDCPGKSFLQRILNK